MDILFVFWTVFGVAVPFSCMPMNLAVIVFVLVFGLWSDRVLYMSVFRRGRVRGIVWKAQAVLFPSLMAVSSLWSVCQVSPLSGSFLFAMWMVWVFLTQFFCKVFFALAFFLSERYSRRSGKPGVAPGLLLPLPCALAVLSVWMMLYGNFVSRRELEVKRVEICSNEVPAAFDGFTMAVVSDFHVGTMWKDGDLLGRVVETLDSLQPDITVHCGDLVNLHADELVPEVRRKLRDISGPVYSVFGNHDLGLYFKDTIKDNPSLAFNSLRDAERFDFGWILLENGHRVIRRGCDSIVVAGVTNPNNLNHTRFRNTVNGGSDISRSVSGVRRDAYTVLLSHNPKLLDSLPSVADGRVDLMISGHTHASQMKIGGFSPGILLYRHCSGLYRKHGTDLYVNQGIGTVGFPFRFGAPPEITLIVLKSGSDGKVE